MLTQSGDRHRECLLDADYEPGPVRKILCALFFLSALSFKHSFTECLLCPRHTSRHSREQTDTNPCTRGAYDCVGTGRKTAETHTGKTSSGELNGARNRGALSLVTSRLASGRGGVAPEGTGWRLHVLCPAAWGSPPCSQRHSQWQTGVTCSRLCPWG